MGTKWTVEQLETVIAEAKDLGDFRADDPRARALAALAHAAEWVVEEARAARRLAREGLEASVSPQGAVTAAPRELVQRLALVAKRGPAEDDEEIEPALRASVATLAGVQL